MVPIKLKELMEWLDYKNEKTFRENYIKPLRESELIEMTDPENSTHPENRYKATMAGIHFITGMEQLDDRLVQSAERA